MRVAQTVLRAIPSAPGMISTADLARACGMSRHDIANAADRLCKRGLVSKAKLGQYQRKEAGDRVIAAGLVIRSGPPRFGIDASGKPAERGLRSDRARGRNTLTARAWLALRRQRKATIPELLETAAAEERDAEGHLGRYLRVLERHGIVARTRHRAPGIAATSNGFVQWVLLSDLGPKAPLWRPSKRQLVDLNTGQVVPLPETQP